MTYGTFKAIVDEVGADKILTLFFDNERAEYYPNGDFNFDDAIEMDGVLVIKTHNKIQSRGVTGGKIDIPVTMYNSGLQAVITLDNETDRKRIDKEMLYNR